MELDEKMRLLDQRIIKYVTSKDPTRKSTSKSVFMAKRELQTFYGNMYSKANQEIKLQQNKSDSNSDRNKLLVKEEQRIRDKIYNRNFYLKTDSVNSQNLSNKENTKMNKNPLISDNSFKASKLIKGKNDSKFLALANAELLMTEFLQKNEIVRERKSKSVTHGFRLFKEKGNLKNAQKNIFDKVNKSAVCVQDPFDEAMPHRKAQLIQLYQNLYEQFTKHKLKAIHSKSRIQGKFSKGVVQQKPPLVKARQSIMKFTMALTNKRAPIKL